ncbi:two-component system response regulator YesN [Paenibacillus rhizosphaerae]|uniref:Two-component system response regulator YesN n=1 Tax=Paenibacillus rhizosphaerae TaxID=297318 RepID=A0A839TFJ9_9BACL|nr:helix-turn-helix domain-containing protein [Paenibacillus rhizosphaerae]MBB3125362.1 two-component system response regulator YesN [Paenibacillus rhizosphaerae]
MLQTLIVDDEPSHIQGLLRHIPWTSLGYTTPLTAETGESGDCLLQTTPIDVLITDISMPGMNGIELAAKAKIINPDIQILIISGYNEFEFAQEAIDVGAKGYVLKPLNLREIERKLAAFRQTLENIKKINEQTLQFKATVSNSRELLNDSFIAYLLEDEPFEESMLNSWCQLLNLPDLDEGIQIIVAMLDDYAAYGSEAESRFILYSALQQSVSVCLQEMGVVLISKLKPDGVAAIIVNPSSETRILIDKEMRFVQEYLRNTFQATVTVGLSRRGGKWNEVRHLIREVKYTISDARQSENGQLLHVGSMEQKAYEEFRSREVMIPGLLSLAESEELVPLLEAVKRAFYDLDTNAHSFSYIQSFSISLIGELSRKLWHDMEAIAKLTKHVWHRLLEVSTIDGLKGIVLDYIASAFEFARKERTLQHHHLIHRVSSYIEDQLPDIESVRLLAERFRISAGHLSVLFKKETGKTISDYVKDLRMKKAKDLLQDPTIKIYEVSERVGFQTQAYFTYQFKKVEGCTPMEYRDRYYRQ